MNMPPFRHTKEVVVDKYYANGIYYLQSEDL